MKISIQRKDIVKNSGDFEPGHVYRFQEYRDTEENNSYYIYVKSNYFVNLLDGSTTYVDSFSDEEQAIFEDVSNRVELTARGKRAVKDCLELSKVV